MDWTGGGLYYTRSRSHHQQSHCDSSQVDSNHNIDTNTKYFYEKVKRKMNFIIEYIFLFETCLYIEKISFTLSQNPSGSFLTDNLSL